MSADYSHDPIGGIHSLLTKYGSAPGEARVYVPQLVGELRTLRIDAALVIARFMRTPMMTDRAEVLVALDVLMHETVRIQERLSADLRRLGLESFEDFEREVLEAESEDANREEGE